MPASKRTRRRTGRRDRYGRRISHDHHEARSAAAIPRLTSHRRSCGRFPVAALSSTFRNLRRKTAGLHRLVCNRAGISRCPTGRWKNTADAEGGIRHGQLRGGARAGTAGVVRGWYIDKRRPQRRRDREASSSAVSASWRTSLMNIPAASSTCAARRAIHNATGVRAVPVAVRSPTCSIIFPQTRGICGKSS
jgi:hypothetical protein